MGSLIKKKGFDPIKNCYVTTKLANMELKQVKTNYLKAPSYIMFYLTHTHTVTNTLFTTTAGK